jgi:hypothetical protein
MSRANAREISGRFVAQRRQIEPGEQGFPRAEYNGPDGQMQLVDETTAQVLPNGRHATAEPDVPIARRVPSLLQRRLNTICDEAEFGPTRHTERRPWMMGKNEDGGVIRRLLPPPASPALIGPWTSDRTEHVPTENPGPDPGQALRRDIVVHTRLAAGIAVHVLPRAGREEPFHQRDPAHPEWIVEILARPRTVPVD